MSVLVMENVYVMVVVVGCSWFMIVFSGGG